MAELEFASLKYKVVRQEVGGINAVFITIICLLSVNYVVLVYWGKCLRKYALMFRVQDRGS